MKGSVQSALGYALYTTAATQLRYFGNDTENDSDPATDWVECQANALTAFNIDTTLSTMSDGYGGGSQYAIKQMVYDYYGSRMCQIALGQRWQYTVSDLWKTSAKIVKLGITGRNARWYNTGAPSWTYVYGYNDYGRAYFRLSEDPNLFGSGAAILTGFGTPDFYLDAVTQNNAYRTAGTNPVFNFTSNPVYKTVPLDFIQNMTGNTLYVWMMVPNYSEAFYNPGAYATVHWSMGAGQLQTYF